jgi:hypothetical protein
MAASDNAWHARLTSFAGAAAVLHSRTFPFIAISALKSLPSGAATIDGSDAGIQGESNPIVIRIQCLNPTFGTDHSRLALEEDSGSIMQNMASKSSALYGS